MVTVAINGVVLATKPAIRITAGAASGDNSITRFTYATVQSGNTDVLGIALKDAAGNVISGLGNSAFNFILSGGASAGTFGTVLETTTKGTYRVIFAATTAGTISTLTVTVNGVALMTTPTIRVTHGPVSGATSTAGFATSTVASGTTNTLTITVADRAGNAISGLARSAFRFALSGGTSTGIFGAVSETSTPGTYAVAFTGIRAGTASKLTTTVNGIVLTAKPVVEVTAGAVSGAKSWSGFAVSTVALGHADTLTIVVRDAAGNLISGLDTSAFGFSLSGGTSDGGFGNVSETTTKGKYTVVFTGATAGTTSTLTITVEGVILTVKPAIRVTGA
jgi:adhesin/invasin